MGENKKQTAAQDTPEKTAEEPVFRHQYNTRSRIPIGDRQPPFRIERKTPAGRVNLRVVKPGTSKLAQSRASLIIPQPRQVKIKVIGRWARIARLAEARKASRERAEAPFEALNEEGDDAEEENQEHGEAKEVEEAEEAEE